MGTARIIRGDKGNENLKVAAIQRYFRGHDNGSMAREESFLYGKSVSNQAQCCFHLRAFSCKVI